VLKGNLAEDGCIVKTAGVDDSILVFAGPAISGDTIPNCPAPVVATLNPDEPRRRNEYSVPGLPGARPSDKRHIPPLSAARGPPEAGGHDTYPLALASPSFGGFRDRYHVPPVSAPSSPGTLGGRAPAPPPHPGLRQTNPYRHSTSRRNRTPGRQRSAVRRTSR